jgi:hypothetical protein
VSLVLSIFIVSLHCSAAFESIILNYTDFAPRIADPDSLPKYCCVSCCYHCPLPNSGATGTAAGTFSYIFAATLALAPYCRCCCGGCCWCCCCSSSLSWSWSWSWSWSLFLILVAVAVVAGAVVAHRHCRGRGRGVGRLGDNIVV